MTGAVIMVVVLVIVFPVVILMSGAIAAALLGHAVKSDADGSNVDADGNPNEYLTLSETDYYS